MKKLLCLCMCLFAVMAFLAGCDKSENSNTDINGAAEAGESTVSDSDKQVYLDYINKEIMPEIKDNHKHWGWSSISTEYILEDVDGDNTSELLFHVFDDSPSIKGPMDRSYYIDIIDGTAKILESSEYIGGTSEWGFMYLALDADKNYVLEKTRAINGGISDTHGERKYYTFANGNMELTVEGESRTRGFDLYGDDLEDAVKAETDVYEKTPIGISTYRLNGVYVYEKEYNEAVNMELDYVSYNETVGDADNPLP